MSGSGGARRTGRQEQLSERSRRILALLVDEFINRGEPVSSLWLAEHSGLEVSSATVRNVLAGLEELGFVRQPHTSAGRVPTDLAYRCYVDQLLEGRRPSRPSRGVEARLRQAASLDDAMDSASQELSRTSHHLGFAISPASSTTTLKHIDFVALDANRVLVVIVATTGHVSHKPVTLSAPLTPTDLVEAANYLNDQFAGWPLSEIKTALHVRMKQDRAMYDRLLARVLELAAVSLSDAGTQDRLHLHGTSSLVDANADDEAGVSMTQLRVLLRMIEEKYRLIEILTAYVEGPGLTVIIGGEHLSPELQGFSLVASAGEGGSDAAIVGVIGPTRMRYSRAINLVESVADVVGRVLADATTPGS